MEIDRRLVLGLGASLAAAGSARAAQLTGAIADIDAYARAHLEAHALPGMTLALVQADGTSSVHHYGYANVDRRTAVSDGHLFQIGSISKSFTALCIFRLMEAGRLKLEDRVESILPEIPLPSNSGITVQSLLNHSSGLPDDAPPFPRGGDQRLWQGFSVGAQWNYSNLGYALLGMIVEHLDGRPLGRAIQALVLDPLNMSATRPAIATADRVRYALGYSPLYGDRAYPRGGPLGPGPWTEMVEGSGSVASTAADMAKYIRYLRAAGRGHGAPLLSDGNAARFCRATIAAPGWASPGASYANGLAVVPIGDHQVLHHTGGMLQFSSAIHVDPVAGVGAFASTNVGMTGYRPRGLTAYACARLRAQAEGRPASSPEAVVPATPDSSALQGRYMARSGEILAIGPHPRGVSATISNREIAMEAMAPDAFIALDPTATAHALVFRRSTTAVERAWWGEREYVRLAAGQPVAAHTPESPPAVAALAGHYENDDGWRGGLRITAQGQGLFIDGLTPLTPLPGGGYRVGEKDWSPERMAFDAFVGGRPRRLTFSGVDYERRAT